MEGAANFTKPGSTKEENWRWIGKPLPYFDRRGFPIRVHGVVTAEGSLAGKLASSVSSSTWSAITRLLRALVMCLLDDHGMRRSRCSRCAFCSSVVSDTIYLSLYLDGDTYEREQISITSVPFGPVIRPRCLTAPSHARSAFCMLEYRARSRNGLRWILAQALSLSHSRAVAV
jgi:hypothetical protein